MHWTAKGPGGGRGCGLALGLALAAWTSAWAAEPEAIRLWPGGAPEPGPLNLGAERDTTRETDGLIAGRRVVRLGNVLEPTLQVYRPPADRDTGAAVLVCPGGGYHILALDLEGTEVCEWLNSIGVTGVLLKYRVPRRADTERYRVAVQDGQRAMGILRERAGEWGIDPGRIGVLGFSAGGHLAAVLSTGTGRLYERVDAADDRSFRPDFAVLVYPGYLTVREEGDRVAPELPVSGETAPTFLVMTQDDPVRMENVLHYALALQAAKVPLELHVYPKGGHGYGLRRTELPVTRWPDRVEEWMRAGGWIR
ncbi:MAG: alpha/beta hydrolase [Verrucomicrobiae bacterium]|nr:alpha/beta hydrolase [Verrucomicrobiae bacterium]